MGVTTMKMINSTSIMSAMGMTFGRTHLVVRLVAVSMAVLFRAAAQE